MTQIRRKPNLSETIACSIREAMSGGAVPEDTLITERALADMFSASRTPVRTAIRKLVDEGKLRALPEGGYVPVGTGDTSRAKVGSDVVSADMLGIGQRDASALAGGARHPIETDFENALLDALPFGQFWINETEAADYFAVSRTIIRELLIKFQDRMLVQKDARSHWIVGPLTARMVNQHYEIRGQLEPLALRQALAITDPRRLEAMIEEVDRCQREADLSPAALAEVETDLHVTLLGVGPNRILQHMTRSAQVPLAITALFRERAGTLSSRSALNEHRTVLDLALRGAVDAACSALEAHITFGAARMRQRLKTISVLPEPVVPSYLKEMRDAVVSR